MKIIKSLSLVMFLLFSSQLMAVEVAGVQLTDEIKIAGDETTLVLNGAGVRSKLWFDIYAAALYLEKPTNDAIAILQNPPKNRLLMHFVYSEVEKAKMDASWLESFQLNHNAEQFAALQERLTQFTAMFGDMKANDVVWLDYLPAVGTRVTINGEEGGVIAGSDFNAALLSVWIGAEPIKAGLKSELLGQ